MANFKMSPGWEKELEKAVRPALKDIASDYQKMFDSLSRRYKGRPVSEIKPALKREWARMAATRAPHWTSWANAPIWAPAPTRMNVK